MYWLARRHTGSPGSAALLALTYLAYPWTAWIALDAFHPVPGDSRSYSSASGSSTRTAWLPFAVCAVLVAGDGRAHGAQRSRRSASGMQSRAAGAVQGRSSPAPGSSGRPVAVAVCRARLPRGREPLLRGLRDRSVARRPGVLRTAVTDPLAIVSEVTHGNDVLYVVLLSVPLGGLFVLSPGLALVALPQLAANLLAGREHVTDPHVHYVAGILPFLFAAAAVGLGRLLSLRPHQGRRIRPHAVGGVQASHWGRGRDQFSARRNGTRSARRHLARARRRTRACGRACARRGGRQHDQPSGIPPLRQAIRL